VFCVLKHVHDSLLPIFFIYLLYYVLNPVQKGIFIAPRHLKVSLIRLQISTSDSYTCFGVSIEICITYDTNYRRDNKCTRTKSQLISFSIFSLSFLFGIFIDLHFNS
jgi:hypothetical protein